MFAQILRGGLVAGVMSAAVMMVAAEATAQTCSGNACSLVKIDRLYPSSAANLVYIGTSGDETQLSCTPVSNVYVTLSPTQPLFRETYDAVLEGLLNHKNMILRILPNSNPCRVLYVTIERLP